MLRLSFVAAGLAALVGCKRDAREEGAPLTSATPTLPVVDDGTCGEGWTGLEGTGCLAVPERFTDPPSLVVFLHGILPAGAKAPPEQGMIRAAARKLGFAVLLAHGKAGLCDWDPQLQHQLCWPVKRETVDRDGPAILAGWDRAQALATRVAGVRFARRYLLGFSNGGYFGAFLVAEGLTALDGAAIVGAGRTALDETRMSAKRIPLYVAVGEQEAEGTRHDAANFAQVLTGREWQVKYVVHPQRGHELHEDDFVAAWEAWGR